MNLRRASCIFFLPGTKSQNIIQAYISTVKVLRQLDPSGVVMEMVLEPCSNYLRHREDAIRQIMQDLLSSSDVEKSDLASELTNVNEDKTNAFCWEERLTKKPEDWFPESRETDPTRGINIF